MKQKLLKIGALISIAAMGFGVISGAYPIVRGLAATADEGEKIIFSEDFSDDPSIGGLSVNDGLARPMPGSDGNALFEYRFKDGEAVASNNYELSFDLRMDKIENNTNLYVHFIDLAGGNGGNTYMSLEGNGAWVCNCTTVGGYATTGTGTPTNYLHGSIVEESVELTGETFRHVRYIHYNGILEVWIDDVRYIVQSLKNIGNNVWDQRKEIIESPIAGFLFHFAGVSVSEPAYYLDNVTLKEIKEPEDVTYIETAEAEESQSKVFGNEITGARLGKESYYVSAEYTIKNPSESAETVKMELCGLNGLADADADGDNYTVTLSAKVKDGKAYPSVEWYDGGLKSKAGTEIDVTGEKFVIKAEVSGPRLLYSINDTVVLKGEFKGDFGMYKGDLQTLALKNSADIVWTSVTYGKGETVVSSVSVTADKRVATVGETVTFTATYSPEEITPTTIEWKVNGSVVEGADGLIYALTGSETGTYKVSCMIDGVESASSFVAYKAADTEKPGASAPTSAPDSEEDKKGGCGSAIGIESALFISSLAAVAVGCFVKRKD